MKMIAIKGHSRIPIYADNPANIIGLILVSHVAMPITEMTISVASAFFDVCRILIRVCLGIR